MKTIVVRQLDNKDEEISDDLTSLGMTRAAPRTLAYLRNVEEASSFELEMGTGLRQPEISIALKQLKHRE